MSEIPPGLRAATDQAVAAVDADINRFIQAWREMAADGEDPEEILAWFVLTGAAQCSVKQLAAMLGVAIRRLAQQPGGGSNG